MLSRILALIDNHPLGLSIPQVAAAIDRRQAAVQGMMEMLEAEGRIVRSQAPAVCSRCPVAAFCGPDDCLHGVYILADRPEEAASTNREDREVSRA